MKKTLFLLSFLLISAISFAHSYGNTSGGYNNSTSWSSGSSTSSSSNSTPRYQTVTVTEKCPHCYGTGKCPTCNGKGWYYNPFGTGKVSCPNCYGYQTGQCSFCRGTGYITKTKTVRNY